MLINIIWKDILKEIHTIEKAEIMWNSTNEIYNYLNAGVV
jgi:hypothetical protein